MDQTYLLLGLSIIFLALLMIFMGAPEPMPISQTTTGRFLVVVKLGLFSVGFLMLLIILSAALTKFGKSK